MRFDVNKICFLGMYSALLRMYGVNVSEEELLVGCKKITFEHHYVYENKKSDDEWKKSDYCYLIGTTDTIKDINEFFGNLTIVDFKSYSLYTEYIIEMAATGIPLLAYVDVFYLPYHPQYQNMHASTMIMIYGLDRNQLLIYDGYVTTIPQTYFCGRVPMDIIDKALWKGKHIDTGQDFGVIIYEKQNSNNTVNYRNSVFENTQSMLSKKNKNSGIIGIKNLAINIREWIEEWNDYKIKDNMRRMYHSITSRGGPAISRNVYAEFLYNNANFLSKNERDLICVKLFNSAKKWNGVAVKAFRCSLMFNDKYIVQISEELQVISCIEHEIWGELNQILR